MVQKQAVELAIAQFVGISTCHVRFANFTDNSFLDNAEYKNTYMVQKQAVELAIAQFLGISDCWRHDGLWGRAKAWGTDCLELGLFGHAIEDIHLHLGRHQVSCRQHNKNGIALHLFCCIKAWSFDPGPCNKYDFSLAGTKSAAQSNNAVELSHLCFSTARVACS